jgi:peptidoglycan/xylan/chitin deacetylase (PgdA/CDA1 family)
MSKQKRIAVFVFIGLAVAGFVFFVRQQYVLPIAMYHSVQPQVPGESRLVVSTAAFERQMSFLARNKYKVLTLEQAADIVKSRKKVSGSVVVITFDDGYEDNYIYAFPILKKYNIPATIFLVYNDIGKPDKLTWEQIREMDASGLITFGSHTLTHPLFDEMNDRQAIIDEIALSKKNLEENLGYSVNTFAYPCGRITPLVRQEVINAGYTAAVVTNPGKRICNDDPFALKRLRISENAGNMFIFWVEISGYYNFIRENRHK